ncbi:SCO family protein [Paracoccus denitrificans]|uniref:SCO family protein n=1 Tax=Paracoccus denitrificans TaxID=266 RepID=UPI000CEBB3FA|nr:SCO family protein [Paracoccus denitrificans]UFS66055.1 SCO family protein [Paracoccus denitrificans]
MRRMGKDRTILILGSLAAVTVLVTGWLWLSRGEADPFAPCRKGVAQGGLDGLGAPFELTDQNGRRVSDRQVLAKPALLYFGYTYCPDVCPLDSARNAEAVAMLEEQGMQVTPVFISVDPKRDTPEVLRDFAGAMHERMIGLTGTAAEIDAVSKAWRNYYKLNDQEDPENYLVDHMTNTYLVIPGSGTVELFGRELSAQDLAERAACFIDAASSTGV